MRIVPSPMRGGDPSIAPVAGLITEVRARAQSLQTESIGALTFRWSMIFSENRFPLFRIVL